MSEAAPTPPARARQRRLARLVALGSLVVALGLGELSLRLFWHNPYRTEAPEMVLPARASHAGTDMRVNRRALDPVVPVVTLRSDARGYVLPSRRFDRPDLTVAFVGGSTTECIAVAEGLRFHHVFSRKLEERGLRVDALNAGRSGNTLHDALNNLVNHIVDDHPDVLVVMHVANDVGMLVAGGYQSRQYQPGSLAPGARFAAQWLSSHTSLGGLLRNVSTVPSIRPDVAQFADKPRDRLRVADPTPYRQRLLAIVRVARAFDIEPVLVTEPLSSMRNALTPEWADMTGQDALNEVVRQVAQAEGVTLVDLARHVQQVPGYDEPMKVFFDGMHVTDAGSVIYGEHLAQSLGPWLERLAAQRHPKR